VSLNGEFHFQGKELALKNRLLAKKMPLDRFSVCKCIFFLWQAQAGECFFDKLFNY
jgi:hypothetical protein